MTTLNQALRTFNQREATQAALKNEQLTRQRVAELERAVEMLREKTRMTNDVLSAHLYLGFWRRLKWLVMGR